MITHRASNEEQTSARAESSATKMYRYVDVRYASSCNEWGESRGVGTTEIQLHEYRVVRTTPKGAWIVRDFGQFEIIGDDARFVLASARKRFACSTLEEARESFIARKRKQIRIYRARVASAEEALRVLERMERAA